MRDSCVARFRAQTAARRVVRVATVGDPQKKRNDKQTSALPRLESKGNRVFRETCGRGPPRERMRGKSPRSAWRGEF